MLIKNRKKGIAASFGVMLLQGWEGIILMMFALVGTFAVVFSSPAFASASLLAKEIFTFIISALVLGNKNILKVFKKGFTKTGLNYALGFIIGSSLGSIFYILAILKAGSGYGVILTAMYPIFTALMLKVFFKDKTNKRTWAGILLTIFGGALFLALPILFNPNGFNSSKLIGMSFSIVTAICWAAEGVILDGIKHTKDNVISHKELAIWKSFVSMIFISVVIMPVSVAFGSPFIIFSKIFASWEGVLISIILAINLIGMRIAYTYSIKNAGARLTSIIDTNNFLVAPLISVPLFYVPSLVFNDGSGLPLFDPIIWWSWFLVIPIFIGVYLVISSSPATEETIHTE